jgi:hypothetical protein
MAGTGSHNDASPTLVGERVPPDSRVSPRGLRLAVAAWVGGAVILFAFMYRIAVIWGFSSDAANIGLQSWQMLHGHLLLHGWTLSDAAFYTFELPLGVITEAVFGLTLVAAHVTYALTLLIVVILAVVLAVTDSRGAARVVRALAVVAVLVAVPSQAGTSDLLIQADHTGTAAFLLGSFLLIDRAPRWRFTPPLLCLILCAGQIGDATVRYAAVPAIIVVCVFRMLVKRRVWTAEGAIALAAAVSYPLATVVRKAMLVLNGYVMRPPRNTLAPASQWPGHLWIALQNIRQLFGAYSDGHAVLGAVGIALGVICLAAAAFGFARVLWSWRSASMADQLLCAAIVFSVAVYALSTIPNLGNRRDIIMVLPCGAVLAARACVPGRITVPRRAVIAVTAAIVAALLPLSAAAARTVPATQGAALAAWLEAHHLRYGIAGYSDASDVTYDSDNRVQVRAVVSDGIKFSPYYWESEAVWYDPGVYDATFAIANLPPATDAYSTVADFERYFGRPAATHRVGAQVVLIYRKNLLKDLVTRQVHLSGSS